MAGAEKPRQAMLDKSKPYGEVHGRGVKVAFEQNYCQFDRQGRYVGLMPNVEIPADVPEEDGAPATVAGAPLGLEHWNYQAIKKEIEARGGTYQSGAGDANLIWLRAHWHDPLVEGAAPPPSAAGNGSAWPTGAPPATD